jgi:hypothetical protein
MRRAQAEDWIEDLVEFEVGDVQNACVEWRRSQHRRPTPSDVRLLAIAEQRNRQARAELRKLPSPGRVPQRKKVLHPWEPGFRKRYDEPWFRGLDYETQQRYMAQDQARLEMHNRVIEGSATDYEFAELCRKQASENLTSKQKVKPEARMSQTQINEAMGAAATERHQPKYEDPEELRRSRVELGLEDAPESSAEAL